MKCPNCNAIIPDDTDICPACFSPVQTAPKPVAPPRASSPVANPRPVENRSEPSSRSREGQQCTPPRENVTTGNTQGRFSPRSPKKPLILVAGILAVIILAAVGYITLANRQAPVPVPVAKEQPAPAPETQAQTPAEQTPAPEKAAEAKPEQTQAPKASPAPKKKVVRKAPAKTQAPAPAPAPSSKWTYRPDPQPAKPAPAPVQKKAGIGAWLDRTLGPEKPVTPPPEVNDSRGTGM